MASFIDPKETVMEVVLTQRGRQLLSQGKLNVKYYAFHDDEIDYQAQYNNRIVAGNAPISFIISGTVEISSSLSAVTADSSITAYQWKRAATFGGGGTYSNISNATASTYTAAPLDIGYDIICVTTNAFGTTTSTNSLRTPTPEVYLGTTAKIILDERNISSTDRIDSWTATGSSNAVWTQTSTSRPFSGAVINGYAAPDFRGAQYMQQTTLGVDVAQITNSGSAFSFFAVLTASAIPAVASNADQGTALIADMGNWFGAGSLANIASGGNKFYTWIFSSGSQHEIGQTISTGSAFLATSYYGNLSLSVRVGNNSATTLTNIYGPTQTVNGLRIAWAGAGTAFYNGLIAELVQCDTNLSDIKKDTIRAYLGNKYAVAY